MFDVGWQELFLIAVVALIAVGPKDLPKALRSAARVLNKARAMSREFHAGLAEIAREVELDEIKRNVERTTRFDLGEELRRSADPNGQLSAEFDPAEFNRKLKEHVETNPPARYPRSTSATTAAVPAAEPEAVSEFPLGDASPLNVMGHPPTATSTGREKTAAIDSGPEE